MIFTFWFEFFFFTLILIYIIIFFAHDYKLKECLIWNQQTLKKQSLIMKHFRLLVRFEKLKPIKIMSSCKIYLYVSFKQHNLWLTSPPLVLVEPLTPSLAFISSPLYLIITTTTSTTYIPHSFKHTQIVVFVFIFDVFC